MTSLRRIGACALGAVLASTLVLVAPPAGADLVIETRATKTPPVTWVDDQGRQHVVTSTAVGDGPSATSHLVVGRMLPDGSPDAAWGSFNGHEGTRELVIEPPAEGAVREAVVAVSDDGRITTTWVAAGCASPSCTRWFVVVDAEGATLATAETVSDDRPIRGLPDGSVVTRDADRAIGWWGPDGTDRGAPPATLPSDTPRVALDAAGRLLLSIDGTLTRWPAGGPVDLEADTSWCALDPTPGGAASDDGYALVCATSEAQASVRRYDADGDLQWTTTITDEPEGRLVHPTAVAVDVGDRVWFGGNALFTNGFPTIATAAIVQSASESGPGPVEYARTVDAPGTRSTESTAINDLRSVAGGRLAVTHHQGCCLRIDGTWPQDDVRGFTVPRAHLPVECTVDDLTIVGADHDQLDVSFSPCADAVARRGPTEYRVQILQASGAAEVIVPDGPGPLAATLPTTSGTYSFVSVIARNPAGPGPEVYPASTIAPFTSLELAAAYLHRDLRGTVDLADVAVHADDFRYDRKTILAVLDELVQDGRSNEVVEPVARLYRAYFLRDADPSGLAYWIRRRDAGERLARVSEQFARSSEFQRRYGSLTNREFVAQVYRNVLDREPDQEGLDFWTARLDSRRNTRGAVMLQFSESSEHIRRTDPTIEPLAVSWLLLGRRPTATERATWDQPTSPGATAALAIIATEEYAERVFD